MKTKILLLFSAILLSISLQAQNTITNLTGPTSVEANTTVSVNFDYELAVEGHIYIRFKNGANTENNLTFVAQFNVPAGSGNLTVALEIPRTHEGEVLPVGTGYNYQAQIFDTGWSGLFTEDYNGVTLTAAQNYIELDNPPTTVNASAFVDVTFNYETNRTGGTHAFVRFKNAGGANLTSASKALSAASGTETLSIEIPDAALGTDYKFQVELFHPSTTWSAYFAVDTVEGITLAEAIAPANSITIVNPETTVIAGRMIDYDLGYTTDESAAYALVRFKGPSGNLEQSFVEVNNEEGTVTVSVLSPETAGTNYSLQAQLYTTGWSELDTYDLSGITVEEYIPTGENTLEIVNTSTDPINNGTLRQVDVKYNLLQTSKILVEVLDKENPASGKKIGDVWIELPAGNDTVTLDLIVDAGFPGTTNRIQALLFDPAWAAITIPEIPYILVGEGDGTITYRGQPYVEGGSQNSYFAEDLGEGYYTNYYIATGWEGPLQMKFEPFGSPSWIEFQNQNSESDGHKEFDIKIQKFSWHADKDYFTDRGFPTALSDIDYALPTTMEGQWSPGSGGKGQINMTAWVTDNGDMAGNRIDIIVHTFHNGGDTRKKFDDNTFVDNHHFNNIGEFTANNGLTYQVLRTLPGYLGEVASYNLIPDSIVQDDVTAEYTTETLMFDVDMKDIIDNLIAKEASYAGTKVAIDDSWQINGLEWTVVGQSENRDSDGTMIPSGYGKFTFNSYTIPDLVDPSLSTESVDSKFQNLTISPNPCTDTFTYKIESQLSDAINIEVFTIDGRKINSEQTSNGNSGTVSTEHLSKGLYLIRITAGAVQETRRLIKN
ncbi:T9SS type A sorting domain-containing protein [Algibacter sp. Ld11]|uniref:T9SS type A sorting domain-containing protein n=1 Tax=Algibacter sp. Ld11 TaxID=649150 RepID=UPI003867ED4A